MNFETIARIAHEVNRVYCQSLGDDSHLPWNDAPEWQKNSAIQGVKYLAKNPDASPQDSHESWMRQKEADGWNWGPVKDELLREHPCMVPYHELPHSQRAKDHFFCAIVRAALGEKE